MPTETAADRGCSQQSFSSKIPQTAWYFRIYCSKQPARVAIGYMSPGCSLPVTSVNRYLVEQGKAAPHNDKHFLINYSRLFRSPKPVMMLSLAVLATLLALSAAQTYPECTAEVARSDDCAAVINANACYNKFRWNAQTLTCIDGNDNAVKQKKVRRSTADDGNYGADHGGA